MTQTQLPDENIARNFRKRQLRQLIMTVPMIGVIIFLMMMQNGNQEDMFGFSDPGPSVPAEVIPLFIAFIVTGVVFTLWNWRCPACKGYLGKAINPRFCARCGAQLRK